jgi:hypothetical protein
LINARLIVIGLRGELVGRSLLAVGLLFKRVDLVVERVGQRMAA